MMIQYHDHKYAENRFHSTINFVCNQSNVMNYTSPKGSTAWEVYFCQVNTKLQSFHLGTKTMDRSPSKRAPIL